MAPSRTPGKKSPQRKAPAKKKGASRKTGRTSAVRAAGPVTGESLEERRRRAGLIVKALKRLYPDADCALTHGSALELLIATILSAQSTDETVNKVMPVLFEKYPGIDALATARPSDLEGVIRPTGFFRQKTKSVIGTCQAILDQFDGEVPASMEELVQLPGVARKTANVVLGTWFGKNEGMVVDTHVGRLAHRLALTWTSKNDKDAVKIEVDLCQVLPRKEWTYVGHALIWHGRRVCSARKPDCGACSLSKVCPSAFSFEHNHGNGPIPKKGAKAKA